MFCYELGGYRISMRSAAGVFFLQISTLKTSRINKNVVQTDVSGFYVCGNDLERMIKWGVQ